MHLRSSSGLGRAPGRSRSGSGSGTKPCSSGRSAVGAWSRRRALTALAAAQDEADASLKSAERRRRMLQYVREVHPASVLEDFLITESPVVVGAMQQTISNLLGTITGTPQFFTVTISTVGENLAMLMNTVMLTGYMLKSAEERFRLRSALGVGGSVPSQQQQRQQQLQQPPPGPAGAPMGQQQRRQGDGGLPSPLGGGGGGGFGASSSSILDEEQFAPGVQKSRVQGDVLFWHKQDGLQTMPAAEYIELLEAEVLRLRKAAEGPKPPPRLPPAAAWGLGGGSGVSAAAAAAAPAPGAPGGGDARPLPQVYGGQPALAVRPHEERNELLEFVRGLDAATVSELTSSATPETAAAMDAFVERLLGLGGGGDRDALRRAASETDATEMRRLLFWLMVVGWELRTLEVRIELDRSLD